MNADVRDSMHDLVTAVPEHLPLHDLPRTAWAAGRRRRLRRQAVTTAATLLVLAFVAGSLLSLGRARSQVEPVDGGSPRATGYPERVEHQWWVTDLPERPGPVAGLLIRPDGHWDVVSQHGRLWRSPQPLVIGMEYPTLSPDGRFLGYLAGNNGPFVIRDLVAGRTTSYPSIACGCSGPSFVPNKRYWMAGQSPAFWSPDGSRLVLEGGGQRADGGDTLLLGPGGHVRLLGEPVTSQLAGWVSPRALAWAGEAFQTFHGEAVDVHIVSIDGRRLRSVRIPIPGSAPLAGTDQWSWRTSPDGRRLLLMTGNESAGRGLVATYSLSNGALLSSTWVPDIATACPSGWAGTVPVVPTIGAHETVETVAATRVPKTLVVSDPRLGSYCMSWASDALSGSPHGRLFGTSTATWTWWWPEEVAALGALALVTLMVRRRSARQRRKATS